MENYGAVCVWHGTHVCACADAAQRELIVGGGNAPTTLFPFMASIQDRTLPEQHFCGGVLLDAQHILTSASCIAARSKFDLRVVLGRTTLSTSAGASFTYAPALLRQYPRSLSLRRCCGSMTN